MKINSYVAHLILFLFILASCNKKKTDAGAPSGGGTTNPVVNEVEAMDLSNCYGEIYFEEYMSIAKGGTATVARYPLKASFYSKPIYYSQKDDLDVGTVEVNNIVLKRNGLGGLVHKFYSDTTLQLISLSTFTLSTSGSTVSSKFAFQYGGGSPVFADTNMLPSEINRSQGLELNFVNVTNADSLIFTLTRNYYEAVTKKALAKGVSKINIKLTSLEIGDLMQNYMDATINVTVFRKVMVRAGGKDYLVHSKKVYSKPLAVSLF